MRPAISNDGERFHDTKKNFVEISETEIKAEFSALILPFKDHRIARAVDCSIDTVKMWKAGRSFPQGRYLMRLVSEFPKIRAWHDQRTGGLSQPQNMSECFAFLEQMMASNTPEGRAMRARFQQIVAEQANV